MHFCSRSQLPELVAGEVGLELASTDPGRGASVWPEQGGLQGRRDGRRGSFRPATLRTGEEEAPSRGPASRRAPAADPPGSPGTRGDNRDVAVNHSGAPGGRDRRGEADGEIRQE